MQGNDKDAVHYLLRPLIKETPKFFLHKTTTNQTLNESLKKHYHPKIIKVNERKSIFHSTKQNLFGMILFKTPRPYIGLFFI